MRDFCFVFFFQAEDGIRDLTVTGVQTCALPIFPVHVSLQQSPSTVHLEPDGKQHLSPEQLSLQHSSLFPLHVAPFPPQQVWSLLHLPLQQSEFALQSVMKLLQHLPSPAQVLPMQQSIGPEHVVPALVQHFPWTQESLQQSAFPEHVVPLSSQQELLMQV